MNIYEIIYKSKSDGFYKRIVVYGIPNKETAKSYVITYFMAEKIISIKNI